MTGSKTEHMAEAIPQVLDALVGTTSAHANTALDNESLANVPKLQAVAEWLLDRLYWAYRSIDSPYLSAKQVARNVVGACDGLDDFYLDMMGTHVECPNCGEQFNIRMWCGEKPARCVTCGKELTDDR